MENKKIAKSITPHFIELNITELCNRKCSFCPRAHGYPNLNLHMSLETAIRIKEQARDFVKSIHIVGRGEPLLNPNFLNILSVLSNDFRISIMTNGDHLYKYISQIHDILNLNSGRNRITISLYDGDEQYNALKEQFKEYADITYYKTYDFGQGTNDDMFNQKHYIANRAGALYSAVSNKPCYVTLNRMFIDWDGSVNLCCHDWSEKAVYGNIFETNIKDIYDFITNNYTKDLVNGNRSCTKQCSKCDVSDDDILKFVYKDWIDSQNKRLTMLNENRS
jgi:radical SAM protein with 4Fe4S-binding SPASM domain